MRLALVSSLAICLAAAASSQDVTDEQVLKAWRGLAKEDRVEVAEWFSAECENLGTSQAKLMARVFAELPQARYDWPEAPGKLPLYDPKVHAPAQPIRRKWLSERSSKVKAWRKKVFRAVPDRRLIQGWRYDYASGSVQRVGEEFDPERIFTNGLAGSPPDLDLAEAIVERALDDGRLRKVHAALGHAYADRSGNAYPGVSLYDVWCSGSTMEMPDVECLGVIHDVLDDWRSWKAPVPDRKHDAMYDRIGELFQEARRQRGLRTALARTYLSAAPVMRDAYGSSADRLHSMWAQYASKPGDLLGALPGEEDDWQDWWEATSRALDNDLETWQGGQARRKALEADAVRVRQLLIGVMREFGALGD